MSRRPSRPGHLQPAVRLAAGNLALLAALLAGCAGPAARVVLLPQPDGVPSAVVVTPRDGAPLLLDCPYAAAEVGRDGRVQPRQLDAATVARDFGPLLQALPPAPRSFVLYFASGGSQLAAGGAEELARIVAEAAARPAAEIDVVGHTDTRGSLEQNDAVGRQRAAAVAELLAARGLPAARIAVQSRGEREPLVPTPDETDEPRNRRVEVRVR